MFLPVFVCLFVYLSVSQQDNSKSYGRIFLKFWGYVGIAQTTSDSILGVIRKESWILDHFEIFVTIASMGHKRNRCKTEDGAAT